MNSAIGAGGVGHGDAKVETVAQLAQWRINSFGPSPYRRSEPFKLGIWNWFFSVEKGRCLCIRLFPEPSRLWKDQAPMARFVLRLLAAGPGGSRRSTVSPVFEKILQTSDDFAWQVDMNFHGRFTIEVEFADLRVAAGNVAEEALPIWHTEGSMQSVASKSSLDCLSRMLTESIHADVTINTADGTLKAHKAILAASSPVFSSMFTHNLKEMRSSTIYIEDMPIESCSALLHYIYGTLQQDEFWKHRLALLAAANKYDIAELKDCCEESLLEDINCSNVFDRLQDAWLYQLHKLKKGCMMYLFNFGKIHDIRDEFDTFSRHADRELMVELFHEILSVWESIH